MHRQYKRGLTTLSLPAKVLKSLAVWQNEKDCVSAETRTSQQEATLRSCSHNIDIIY